MASLNKVLLMGNLTRDPELRYTPQGMPLAKFGVAVNRRYKNQGTGEWVEETTFVDVTVFGRTAENVNQYLSKGRPVFIEGRLKLDTWEDRDGQKRSKLEVIAENVQFLGSPAGGGGGGGGGGGEGGYRPRERQEDRGGPRSDRPPARRPAAPPPPAEPSVQEGPADEDFNLDDIPF